MVATAAAPDGVVQYRPRGGHRRLFSCRDQVVVLEGPAGTGKAQPLDATVYTVDGPKRMGDIALGDMVLTPDGASAPVSGIFPQGEQDVYRLTFSGGDVVECTADHLWAVRYMGGSKKSGKKVREMRAVRTVDDLQRDYLIGVRQRPKYWIPQTAPVAFVAQPVSVPAYTLGMLIGDGHIRSGAIRLATGDIEIVETVQAQIGSRYVVRHIENADYAIVGATAGTLVPKPNLWSDIRDLGLTGKLSADKFVPDRYKYNSIDVRFDILRGLMDADGTVDRKTGMPSFCTVSRRLADDVKWLVESLGGICTITEKQPANGQLAYQCWIRYDDPADLFTLERKRERCKARTKYPVKRMLLSIEKAGRKQCQCISVDHPDRLYLTDHFVVTHNTYACLWYLHAMALMYPGMRALMARKTLASLTGSAQVTYQEQILGSGIYNVTPFGGSKFRPGAYIYPNGSQVVVGGMDKSSKVMSAEYDLIYVPEATELTETDAQALTTRLRHGVMPYQQLLMDCNPAGPQHWINQWCNKARATRITTTHKDNPVLWDRKAEDWTEFGREYMSKLWPLTGSMRKRLLDGVWAGSEGLVYPEFEHEKHVRETVDRRRFVESDRADATDVTDWRTVLGVDVGSRNPTAILTSHVSGDERLHISRETYRSGMSSTDIVAAIDAEATRVNPATIYIDPSAKMIIDDVRRLGWDVTPANNDVVEGIRRVHGTFQRGLTIDPTCTNTIDELGMYAYQENPRIETDNPVKDHDHAMDTVRYIVAGEMSGDGDYSELDAYMARQLGGRR